MQACPRSSLRQELRKWEEDSYTTFHCDLVSCNQAAYQQNQETILAQLRGCHSCDTVKRERQEDTPVEVVKRVKLSEGELREVARCVRECGRDVKARVRTHLQTVLRRLYRAT